MEREWDAEYEAVDSEGIFELDGSMSVDNSNSIATGAGGDSEATNGNTSSGIYYVHGSVPNLCYNT